LIVGLRYAENFVAHVPELDVPPCARSRNERGDAGDSDVPALDESGDAVVSDVPALDGDASAYEPDGPPCARNRDAKLGSADVGFEVLFL
jgi:hypothetical protein